MKEKSRFHDHKSMDDRYMLSTSTQVYKVDMCLILNEIIVVWNFTKC